MTSLASRSQATEAGALRTSVELRVSRSYEAAVEGYLGSLTFSNDPRLAKLVGLMQDALSAGGTRIRPLLCMEAAGAFGLNPTEVLPAATAIELVHTGSLVHGRLQVMGDDPGTPEPSYRAGCDDATVILAGDAFFSEALAMISHVQKGESARLVEAIRELAKAVGARGVIGGQALTVGIGKGDPGRETLDAAHRYGTESLFVASARIGAILGGASEEEKRLLASYARHVGRCMRASSDVPKTNSSSGRPGSGVGGASSRREASSTQIYGPRAAKRLADEAFRKALEVLGILERDTEGLARVARFACSGSDSPSPEDMLQD